MSALSITVARWGLRIAPRLTTRLAAPRVRGTTASAVDGGTLVVTSGASGVADASGAPSSTGASGSSGHGLRTVVVIFSPRPLAMRWLAATLAKRLSAAVVIVDSIDDPIAAVERARFLVDSELPVTVVGEGSAAAAALDASRQQVRRVALIAPREVGPVDPAGVPTTLIQDSESSPSRAETVALERALRSGGVGVREPGYRGVTDGWARLPRVSSGTQRALDDLVQFVERGVGPTATFDVIPGWDLH
ncbi:hypothetical protein [Marisediminicola sp. LYQ134]|uniref:hypothetical protein n=1 Tax=Marisediminicola sp. LYQ134 TaxID=3391061 RepID=UPI0039830E52